jgi:hypothetical protein
MDALVRERREVESTVYSVIVQKNLDV